MVIPMKNIVTDHRQNDNLEDVIDENVNDSDDEPPGGEDHCEPGGAGDCRDHPVQEDAGGPGESSSTNITLLRCSGYRSIIQQARENYLAAKQS